MSQGFYMIFRKLHPLRALAAFLLFYVCSFDILSAPKLFVAKELQLKDSIPSEEEFSRSFEDPLPAMVSDAEGKRLIELANCRDYLAVRDRITGSDNEADYRVLLLQTVPCLAMALLKLSGTASQSALPEDFLQYTDTSAYPASIWPTVSDDEHQRLEQTQATLQTVSEKKSLKQLNDETLQLEASDFGLRLTLLACADFDHDGWEDAAFRWEGYALHGSYSNARLVVLTRTSKDGPFRELVIESLLQQDQTTLPVIKGQ
ncbi:MAG: hypothetical protein M8364_14005 [Methylobacter sp.]|uniref:hypothetical protein n=1 Tax=Methylobacter sp. TaxID=2051955 RepID=UPI00259008FE|nr:hypothetical protein [Methylobacter sp.]MCL7422009.1 hypothetical protein [Methylobacter sp.]